MKPEVELYTDGSCPRPGGPGGWAFLARIKGTSTELRGSGGTPETTNNRMELAGVVEGLTKLSVRPCRVTLVSDSEYVVKGVNEWLPKWKKKNWMTSEKNPVKNDDLWKEIDGLMKIHEVTAVWTRGHAGHVENEWCDQAAGEESAKFKAQVC